METTKPLGHDHGHEHHRHHDDEVDNHGHELNERDDDGDGTMVPMTITVTRAEAGGMPPTAGGPAGLVAATVEAHVPAINCRAVLSMTYPAPVGSTRADWAEIACERALMMLDPA